MPSAIGEAYSRTGAAWQHGPGAVYDGLADVVVEHCPIALDGCRALDLGAGTGAASRAIARRGGDVVAVDLAIGMLRADREVRPPAAVANALALPLRDRSFHAVIAAFSLNHLDDPVPALREARRVLRNGGAIVASAYAEDDTHPAKAAAEDAARAHGWSVPAWYQAMREHSVPKLATVERATAAIGAVGLRGHAVAVRVAFPDFGANELIAWRLGMAQLAPFVSSLDADARAALVARAVENLDVAQPLVRSIIVLVATLG